MSDNESENDRRRGNETGTEPESESETGTEPEREVGDGSATDASGESGRDLRRYAERVGLWLFVAAAAVAAVQLYFSVSWAIDLWVAERFQPLVESAFNLVVLLLAVAGVLGLSRRLDR